MKDVLHFCPLEHADCPNDEKQRYCSKCKSQRSTRICHKCNIETVVPTDNQSFPRLPDIKVIRSLAREKGYAIGVHGTLERDLDLIAVPWIDDCAHPTELIRHLCDGLNAVVLDSAYKPHGRLAVNLQIDGYYKLIDLSIYVPNNLNEETQCTT